MKFPLYSLLLVLFFSCAPFSEREINYDLVIKNTSILDVETGNILKNKSILVLNGKIKDIVDSAKDYNSNVSINANNKLTTPSFIDTHIHPTDVYGDREKAPKSLDKNARKKLSDAFLPYGTTTTLMLGQPKNWLDTIINWQNNSAPEFTDHYTSGGALISKENHKPYIGHQVVENAKQTREIINEYYKLGIRHIKLYYRLNSPEFKIAYKTADSLKMKTYGHIGGFELKYLKINETLNLGLKNYEHLFILPCSVLTESSDWEKLNEQFNNNFGALDSESRVFEYLLEQYRYLDENKEVELNLFIDKLAENNASISTTIHAIYEQFHETYFTRPKDRSLTKKQIQRCNENFSIFIKYVKIMISKGIELRLGSDRPYGGKINLSELILLSEHGISAKDIFKITSYNGAKAMGIENEVGTIKNGKKANLIIWDKSPFDDTVNFKAKKTIVKDGKIVVN